jgi:ADP-glucose type glycogen/starch synthase
MRSQSLSQAFGKRANPRILLVTPEITYLPPGMGNMANRMNAKAGGLADVSASLVGALFEMGADVHVALPHYRRMFHIDAGNLISNELRVYQSKLPNSRIHLAEDRVFYYRDEVYSNYAGENPKIALAFQREVINNIIPTVNPDLIHCNDWMTGIVPAMARRMGIPCLFTLHNIHTHEIPLTVIEDRGIDAAGFWKSLYYKNLPRSYEETRANNLVDLLATGIFAAHYINTVSPSFLSEIVAGYHDFIPPHVRAEIKSKVEAGCAVGILNAPDPSFNPSADTYIERNFDADSLVEGKRANKLDFQSKMGLARDEDAPILFWPSRLDPIQKGPQLLAHILYDIISSYWEDGLQVAFVANGAFQKPFHDIVQMHDFYGRVAVCDFDEGLSHLGYAASDFMLIPSRFEPCGLPQMISCLYGSLPIAHDTGGLRDTVEHISVPDSTGNGFLFRVFDPQGLRWAIDEAMRFYRLPAEIRTAQLSRIMRESAARFTHTVTAGNYFDIYEQMLQRPLVTNY